MPVNSSFDIADWAGYSKFSNFATRGRYEGCQNKIIANSEIRDMSRMSDLPHLCQIFTLFWYGKNKIESVLPDFIRKYSSVPCFTWKRGSIGSKSDSCDML